MPDIKQMLKDFDVNISYKMYSLYPKTARARKILLALEWSCHGIPWFIAVIVALYAFPENSFLVDLLTGLILDILFVAMMKALTRRRRPVYSSQGDQLVVVSVDKHSMPSGHSSRAVYLAILMQTTAFSFITIIWAAMVAFSRVFLGRHHVFDIIAGTFLAFFTYHFQFGFGGLVNSFFKWGIKQILGVNIYDPDLSND